MKPVIGLIFHLQNYIAGSCSHPPQPPSLSSQGCFQSTLYPACTSVWDCPEPDARPCTWPCWTLWCLHGPSSQGPFDGIPSLQYVDHTTQACVTGKLAEGPLNPPACVTDWDGQQQQCQQQSLRNTIHHWSPLGQRAVDLNSESSQPANSLSVWVVHLLSPCLSSSQKRAWYGTMSNVLYKSR